MKDSIDAILRREQAEYLEQRIPPREALLDRMEDFARENGHPIADPEVAQMLRILVSLRKPKRILEVGTNIGYSVIVMGRESGAETTIETIELNKGILSTARGFVAEAGLECKVVFHAGAALDVMKRLEGKFDFAFIDCVKEEYPDYLDLLLPKMEQGGVIVADNVLWKGQVAAGPRHPSQVESTEALRRFNEKITKSERLLTTIVPVGDGLAIAVVLG